MVQLYIVAMLVVDVRQLAISRPFAFTVMDLLWFGTIQAVARYLQVGWNMVKEIRKSRLHARAWVPRLKDLICLNIDQFSIRKGHARTYDFHRSA